MQALFLFSFIKIIVYFKVHQITNSKKYDQNRVLSLGVNHKHTSLREVIML
jgi:hypothetical protein